MAKGELTITLDKNEVNAVNKWLSEMSDVDKTATVQTAFRDGSLVLINAGKANLAARNKVVTGNLKRSFTTKVNKKKAYALSGFKRPKGAHAHLVDRGTKKRYTKNGYYRGSAKGTYFWTDAVEANGEKAINAVMDAVYKSLETITNRNAK